MKSRRMSFVVALVCLSGSLLAAQEHEGHQVTDDRSYVRSMEQYEMPPVTLMNQDRERVELEDLLSQDKPVLLDFIFATCTTICPVMSAGFSGLQGELGENSEEAQLVSISIDPEHDTPEVMAKYLKRYRAQPGWDFLTGSRADIEKVMRAFDSFVPDKMSHRPVTFLRAPGAEQWVKIDGLIGSADLIEEYRGLQGHHHGMH